MTIYKNIIIDTTMVTENELEKILTKMSDSPQNVKFSELFAVCTHYFGEPRHKSGSHYIFKTPWPGDPRINIQDDHGKAKTYQVRQVLAAINKLAGEGYDKC